MTRLLCVILLVACRGTPRDPAHPTGAGSATAQAGSAAARPDPAPVPQDSSRNCDKLIDHAVTLAVAERPADQQPTTDERTKIASELRASWSPKCSQMTGRGYDCALAAHTLAELERCGG